VRRARRRVPESGGVVKIADDFVKMANGGELAGARSGMLQQGHGGGQLANTKETGS
jgi:hypothetical protein